MKHRNVVWSIVVSAVIVLVAGALVLPSLNRTNCGGNSAALAACRAYITLLRTWSADHPGEAFRLDRADTETLHDLSHLPGTEDLRAARLLAARDDVRIDPAAGKRIIMVCDHAFDNVPRRWWGRAPMTHAAAYSTGEVGLITPQEFARLDTTNFVDLHASNTSRPNTDPARMTPPLAKTSEHDNGKKDLAILAVVQQQRGETMLHIELVNPNARHQILGQGWGVSWELFDGKEIKDGSSLMLGLNMMPCPDLAILWPQGFWQSQWHREYPLSSVPKDDWTLHIEIVVDRWNAETQNMDHLKIEKTNTMTQWLQDARELILASRKTIPPNKTTGGRNGQE